MWVEGPASVGRVPSLCLVAWEADLAAEFVVSGARLADTGTLPIWKAQLLGSVALGIESHPWSMGIGGAQRALATGMVLSLPSVCRCHL